MFDATACRVRELGPEGKGHWPQIYKCHCRLTANRGRLKEMAGIWCPLAADQIMDGVLGVQVRVHTQLFLLGIVTVVIIESYQSYNLIKKSTEIVLLIQLFRKMLCLHWQFAIFISLWWLFVPQCAGLELLHCVWGFFCSLWSWWPTVSALMPDSKVRVGYKVFWNVTSGSYQD